MLEVSLYHCGVTAPQKWVLPPDLWKITFFGISKGCFLWWKLL